METTVKDTRAFVETYKIRASVAYGNRVSTFERGDWRLDANPWTVTLRFGSHRLTVPYWTGKAITEPPDAAMVLDCLASDASGAMDQRFEDWASDYGYDPDSRSAERTYRACRATGRKLIRLLGENLFSELLYQTERL